MKALHVGMGILPIPSLDQAGGSEQTIYSLTNQLVRQGCRTWIVDVKAPPAARHGSLASFYEVGAPPLPGQGTLAIHLRSVTFACLAARAARHLVWREGIEVVQVHSPYAVFTCRVLARLKEKTPLIFAPHYSVAYGGQSFKRSLASAIDRMAFRLADHIVTETRASKDEIVSKHSLDPAKISYIPAAIDTDHIDRFLASSGPANQTQIVLCVGRIHPRKNQLKLVQAIPQVVAKFPDARFVFAGPVEDPIYFAEMQDLVLKKGIQRSTEFVGTLPQVQLYELYRKATVFAFPTANEMFGRVLVEAFAFGLATVSTKIPQLLEIIGEDLGAAILVDPDDVEGFAQGILSLLGDRTLRESLSARGRKVAQRYTSEETARQALLLYERLVRSRREPNH
jgi:glycosyltransferase involved in cell wall biosynthesis